MKRPLLALSFVLASLSVAGCGSPIASSGTPSQDVEANTSAITAKTFSVYGLSIGDSKDKLIEKLGVPFDKQSVPIDNKTALAYNYRNVNVLILDDRIYTMTSTDMEFKTKQGVAIGDSFEKLVQVYGKQSLQGTAIMGGIVMKAFLFGDGVILGFDLKYHDASYPPKVESIAISKVVDKRDYETMTKQSVPLQSQNDWRIASKHTSEPTPSIEEEQGKKLIAAVKKNDLEQVKMLLAEGADPNAADRNGETALMLAAIKKMPGMVNLLLDAGADPNKQGEDAKTALLNALFNTGLDPEKSERDEPFVMQIVSSLLAEGADANSAYTNTRRGTTALMMAAMGGYTQACEALLDAGADPNAADIDGHTALYEALANKDAEIMNLLVSRHADVNAIDRDGMSLLNYAEKWQLAEMAELLKQLGARPGRNAN